MGCQVFLSPKDSLVEAYDQHVSPVLGGNDTSRNEQKRKRHLESWWLGKGMSECMVYPTQFLTCGGDSSFVTEPVHSHSASRLFVDRLNEKIQMVFLLSWNMNEFGSLTL